MIFSVLLLGVFIGWLLSPSSPSVPSQILTVDSGSSGESGEEQQFWTCSMHPQIQQPSPGKCPICGMDLIPISKTSVKEEQPGGGIPLSRQTIEVANVQFAKVHRMGAKKHLRLPATVEADESKLIRLTSHVPSARIEKLYVNFEGAFVRKGEAVAKIYSPEIITAHRELLLARNDSVPRGDLEKIVHQKFRNWKFTEQQIAQLANSREVQSTVEILSPLSGYVLKLYVREGDHPKEGTVIAEIADLSSVWIWIDLYEQHLPFVRVGSSVRIEFEALPGKRYSGTISYIEPTINPKTRTTRARVILANPGNFLRPGMYGLAEIMVQQPSVLAIPKTAVLWTGERSIVYVKVAQTADRAIVRPRQVRIGAELGNSMIQVLDGLIEGEEVVSHGTFVVDASAQLLGFESMMSTGGEAAAVPHQHQH